MFKKFINVWMKNKQCFTQNVNKIDSSNGFDGAKYVRKWTPMDGPATIPLK